MRLAPHKNPDIDLSHRVSIHADEMFGVGKRSHICALISRAGEDDVAKAGRDRGAEGGEVGGVGRVVGFAVGRGGGVGGWVAGGEGVGSGAGDGEEGECFVEGGLRPECGIEGEIRARERGAGVEAEVEARELGRVCQCVAGFPGYARLA